MEIIMIIYVAWVFIGTAAYFEIAGGQKCAFSYYGLITKYLYDTSEMNIIGCILLAILYYIVFPIMVLRSVVMFIYWLLHKGRKKHS